MADETTDISNTEQLALCLRFVDDQLVSHEEFIGLHSMKDTTAERITRTIEDIFCDCLSLLRTVVDSAMMGPVQWLAAKLE